MAGKTLAAISVLIMLGAWITFAEHPTARNLRTAVIDTLPFLE
jgi:hypothetical protein